MHFDSQGDEYGAPPQRAAMFDLTSKLVSWGLVSTPQEAQYVLIAVAVIAVLIAGYLLIGAVGGGGHTPPPLPVSA